MCTPTALYLPPFKHASLACGPLSNHAFVICSSKPAKRLSVPVLDYNVLLKLFHAIKEDTGDCHNGSRSLRVLKEAVALGYSSPSVLSCSFLTTGDALSHFAPVLKLQNSWPDLTTVGMAYELIVSCGVVVNTLRRASLQCAQQLRLVPSDELECVNLYVSMLLNPLMLQPESSHVAFGVGKRQLSRMLSIINTLVIYLQITFFSWFPAYWDCLRYVAYSCFVTCEISLVLKMRTVFGMYP